MATSYHSFSVTVGNGNKWGRMGHMSPGRWEKKLFYFVQMLGDKIRQFFIIANQSEGMPDEML